MRETDPGIPRNRDFRVHFAVALMLVGAAFAIYIANIVAWRNSPNFGWRPMYDSGPNIVAETFDIGEAAGLRVGDVIKAINGIPYNTFDDLYYKVRCGEPGSVNEYSVIRDGNPMEIRIVTGRLGLSTVLRRSGLIFAIGFVYVIIGGLVFLMKPKAGESWIFFVMASFLGMEISFGAPSDLLRPPWFYDIRLIADTFIPAPLIHFAFRFPKTRAFLLRSPWIWSVPYVVSAALFLAYKATTRSYWGAPPLLDLLSNVYLLLSVLIFLVSMVWDMVKDRSNVVRLQSRVIFIGIILGIFVPVADMLLRFLWKVYLFPDPSLGAALFLTAFPLSIGYTIVKHDLFAIDVIVRRTYGYVLSTGMIAGVYSLILSGINLTFQSTEFAHSPYFSLGFALAAVFSFRPLHERIQRLVDRVFYRQGYDYRKTIQAISEAMTSVFDAGQIQRMLVGSVVSEMVLENGLLALRDPAGSSYRVGFAEGFAGEVPGTGVVSPDAPLLGHLRGRNAPIFRHDVELDPGLQRDREALLETFDRFHAEAMLPLRYKDKLQGILSLGRKKSGKIFTHEDVDLLKTISSQGAVALENARLFEENLVKGRMEEELKIARDIQTSMLPESAPEIEGFEIAATSIPAREVGGDFYDFIPVGEARSAGRLAIVVGDVSGKAVSGALVMAASRSVFRVLSEGNATVEDVMNRANIRLKQDVKKGMFVATLYAVLDPEERSLSWSNAGQTQPVHYPGDGSAPAYLDTDGDRFPLGIVEECRYEASRVSLKAGDVVVLYTDGVVEAINGTGEMYGFDRFLAAIGEKRSFPAQALLARLVEDVECFVGGVEQHDDITIVVVKAV